MANSNEYMNNYMKERYNKRRELAITTLGGRCAVCGVIDDLEVDHIDKNAKDVNFSKMWNMALVKFMKELEKCQLLCHDHHKKKSAAEKSVPHGGGLSGKKNCKCDPCKARKADYMRKYMAP